MARPTIPIPPNCNPHADTLSAIAAREGVSVPTVRRWRAECPEMKPAPVEKPKATRGPGRPRKVLSVFAADLDARHPGAVSLCESNASHAAIGLAYGVSAEAVRQWREKVAPK